MLLWEEILKEDSKDLKLKQIKMHSNGYIFRFAIIMVIAVAVILTATATLLKPFQDDNKNTEKMQDVVKAAFANNDDIEITVSNTQELYEKYIYKELLINPVTGEIVSEYSDNKQVTGDVRAFDVKLKDELAKQKNGEDAAFPLFIAKKDGEEIYVIPLYGKGLWGPIWGNVALASDMQTVVGAIFDHKAETPGLGAEITDADLFQNQFIGKKIFDDEGNFTSITVIKGGVANQSAISEEHGVDAISGGTITSVSVSDMLHDCLTNYVEFIKKNK
jgi:Na+-transporting NADH:ubiquinone oxidoreductase subunit C